MNTTYEAAAAHADSDLAHIKAPSGTTHGMWERNLDRDCWSRTLLYETHGEDEKATVDVSGMQYDDGTHDVGITVWGVSEGEPLTASQARRLAVHLLQAADSVSPIESGEDTKMTNYDALVQALVLAVTAPTEEQAARAVALGEQIAAGLSEVEVARAKREAEETLAAL